MKKTRKRAVVTAMAATLSVLSAATGMAAGWSQDEKGYWYQYEDGNYASGGMKTVDGIRYGFDAQGYMLTGWQKIEDRWRYFDPATGAQAMEWTQIDGKWYYFEPDQEGAMHTFWLDLGNKRYYMDENGVMQTGVFYLQDSVGGSAYAYEADESGVLIRNTTRENENKTILYDENGVMKYRNNTTRKISTAEGGSTWQYVLNEKDMQGQKVDNAARILTAVQEHQDNFYDEYKSKVVTEYKAARREKALASWEEKVRRDLTSFAESEQIEDFIARVKQGRYCKYEDRDPKKDDEWYDEFYYEYETSDDYDPDDYDYDDYDDYEEWD